MPETIISQFQRAYNSPIETRRQVNTSTDRDNIPSSVRWRGMLVHVISDDVTYELVGGIDNGSWQVLGGLQDAPSDGETYGRRNASWEILDFSLEKTIFKIPPQTVSGTTSNILFDNTITSGNFPLDNDSLEIFTFWRAPGVLSQDVTLGFNYGGTSMEIDDFGNFAGGSYIMKGFIQRVSASTVNMTIYGGIDAAFIDILTVDASISSNSSQTFQVTAQDSGGANALEMLGGYVRKI